MATGIEVLLVNAGVSTLFNMMFSAICQPSPERQDQRIRDTFQSFLTTLSRDFQSKIESAVRQSFLDHSFEQIKIETLSALNHLSQYVQTIDQNHPRGELTALGRASASITDARSRLEVQCDNFLQAALPAGYRVAETREVRSSRIAEVKRIQETIKLLFYSLKSVGSLELLILSKRAEEYPGLSRSIRTKVTQLIEVANRIREKERLLQPLRIVQVEEGLGDNGFPLTIVYDKDQKIKGKYIFEKTGYHQYQGIATFTLDKPPHTVFRTHITMLKSIKIGGLPHSVFTDVGKCGADQLAAEFDRINEVAPLETVWRQVAEEFTEAEVDAIT